MSNQNKAEKQTIAEIKDKFFEIPPYQRLYEWESTQIEELLNDIKKAWYESNQYFIGNITTSIDKDDSNKFVLIDGQQRLTTLWFIGFYLASKGCGEWKTFITQGDKLRITMPIRDKEKEALENIAKKIQKSNSQEKLEFSKDLQGNNIHQKIIDAFECIEKWFNTMFGKYTNGKLEIDDLKRLKCFSLFIYRRVCFVFVELAQNTDLNRFFVRMNNRGKQLEKHEILKARILDKIKGKDNGGNEWQKYAKIWDLCSDMNKYIFRSASDRKIFEKENKDKETLDKVESIIDFPTFLLHCYKLWVAKKCNENKIPKEITIAKYRLLEIMWDAKEHKDKHDYLFIQSNKQDCKDFIIDMLRYRVLFDYFVIKNTLSDVGFAIMRFYKNNNTYQPKANSLKKLAMIQNYLRVARQGDRQNYHHWLTPFLKFLDKSELINYDYIKISSWNLDKICENFSKNDEGKQDDLVKFLKTLDTNLAIAQLSDNELLDETNKAIKEVQNYQPTKAPAKVDWNSLLNNGTETPHYWFYRLEYYLWKWGTYKPKKLGNFYKKLDNYSLDSNDKNCVLVSKYFHFRMLGSIEHFSARQREKKQEKWGNLNKLDIFGNLALISQNFNSSLSNQLEQFKKDEVIKQLKRGRLESLKYFIMCANLNGNEWSENDSTTHQEQMIKILAESLGLNQKDSQDSSNSKETK